MRPHPRLSLAFALAAVLVVAGVTGCVRYPGGIAASNVPLEPNGYDVIGPTQGSDCKVDLLGLLPVSGGNTVADALKEALNRKPGTDAMVQITVDRVSKYFILWSQTCTEVRGLAVRRR